MNNIPISVLTIVKSRQEALQNLLLGLENAAVQPAELVIVNMNEAASGLTSAHFPVRAFQFNAAEKLPLAAARNFAASKAANPLMIFLDVDCIPSARLVEAYYHACAQGEQLCIGPVRYLRQGAVSEPVFLSKMPELSTPDPVRGDLQQVNHALFWSLNFACSKTIYDRIGGFDTRFTGYGAEDTDFGFAARQQNIPLQVVEAVAYHQYHPSYDPPLNHFLDIITNAEAFYEKWKIWPMEGWLRKFVHAGMIAWEQESIRILRTPHETEIAAALKK